MTPVGIPTQSQRKERERRWKTFSADDKAYEQGKERGRTELLSIVDETVKRNLGEALRQSEQLFTHLEEETEVQPDKVFVRIDSTTEFCSLILVPESDYVSDDMFEVMKEAKRREAELMEQAFSLDFGFMPMSEHTSHDAIVADGFNYSYPEIDEQ